MRAVLFDYGGTLVEIHRPDGALDLAHDRMARRLAREPGLRPVRGDDLRRAVHDHVDAAAEAHARSGELTEIDLTPVYREAYAAILGAVPGPELLGELIRTEQRAWFEGVTPRRDAAAMLARLRAAGLRLGVCSNAPYLASTLREQIAHVGLAGLLDSITLSSEAGRRKPSPELFAQALGDLGAAAAETVMVGDRRREDVAGAQAAGLLGVWLRTGGGEAEPAAFDPDGSLDTLAELPSLLGI